MNLFFMLLLLALIVGGYYVYQRLLTIERDIRADQRSSAEEDVSASAKESGEEASPGHATTTGAADVQETLSAQVLRLVREHPGFVQPELYVRFGEDKRRELQKLLRELDQQGLLRREKKGNSYRLYPL